MIQSSLLIVSEYSKVVSGQSSPSGFYASGRNSLNLVVVTVCQIDFLPK